MEVLKHLLDWLNLVAGMEFEPVTLTFRDWSLPSRYTAVTTIRPYAGVHPNVRRRKRGVLTPLLRGPAHAQWRQHSKPALACHGAERGAKAVSCRLIGRVAHSPKGCIEGVSLKTSMRYARKKRQELSHAFA